MKKTLVLIALLATMSLPLTAQTPVGEPAPVPLNLGMMIQNDSITDVTPWEDDDQGGHKSPARPHYVGLNGHTLYTYGQFGGYTLYIINDVNAVVYTTEVWADEQTVALPEWLTGTYTLVFADDDGGCYYGEIEL